MGIIVTFTFDGCCGHPGSQPSGTTPTTLPPGRHCFEGPRSCHEGTGSRQARGWVQVQAEHPTGVSSHVGVIWNHKSEHHHRVQLEKRPRERSLAPPALRSELSDKQWPRGPRRHQEELEDRVTSGQRPSRRGKRARTARSCSLSGTPKRGGQAPADSEMGRPEAKKCRRPPEAGRSEEQSFQKERACQRLAVSPVRFSSDICSPGLFLSTKSGVTGDSSRRTPPRWLSWD